MRVVEHIGAEDPWWSLMLLPVRCRSSWLQAAAAKMSVRGPRSWRRLYCTIAVPVVLSASQRAVTHTPCWACMPLTSSESCRSAVMQCLWAQPSSHSQLLLVMSLDAALSGGPIWPSRTGLVEAQCRLHAILHARVCMTVACSLLHDPGKPRPYETIGSYQVRTRA